MITDAQCRNRLGSGRGWLFTVNRLHSFMSPDNRRAIDGRREGILVCILHDRLTLLAITQESRAADYSTAVLRLHGTSNARRHGSVNWSLLADTTQCGLWRKTAATYPRCGRTGSGSPAQCTVLATTQNFKQAGVFVVWYPAQTAGYFSRIPDSCRIVIIRPDYPALQDIRYISIII